MSNLLLLGDARLALWWQHTAMVLVCPCVALYGRYIAGKSAITNRRLQYMCSCCTACMPHAVFTVAIVFWITRATYAACMWEWRLC
jgi:hypothetical protein